MYNRARSQPAPAPKPAAPKTGLLSLEEKLEAMKREVCTCLSACPPSPLFPSVAHLSVKYSSTCEVLG